MNADLFLTLSRATACTLILLGFTPTVSAQTPDQSSAMRVVKSEAQGSNLREIQAPSASAPGRPLIGFIDSPTAMCYQPDSTADACYINWYYLNVDASPDYMISMTAEINVLGKVARYQGFFQSSMYVPHTMHGRGFKVACGVLGVGGDPEFGNVYAYTIRAKDSNDQTTANYGSVSCPAFVP